jgi:hypothetical protein
MCATCAGVVLAGSIKEIRVVVQFVQRTRSHRSAYAFLALQW